MRVTFIALALMISVIGSAEATPPPAATTGAAEAAKDNSSPTTGDDATTTSNPRQPVDAPAKATGSVPARR